MKKAARNDPSGQFNERRPGETPGRLLNANRAGQFPHNRDDAFYGNGLDVPRYQRISLMMTAATNPTTAAK